MSFFVGCISAAVISFVTVFLGGFVLTPYFRKKKYSGKILTNGSSFNDEKQNTPVWGGIFFAVSVLVSFFLIALFDKIRGGSLAFGNEITGRSETLKLISGIVSSLGFGFTGFTDDFIKQKSGLDTGLKTSQKTFMQIVLSASFLLTLFMNDGTGSIFVPFCGMIETRVFFWIIGLPVIYCTVNGAEFTCGAKSRIFGTVTFTASVCFICAAVLRKCSGAGLLASSVAGALSGSLILSGKSYDIIKSGTSSMFLGGMLICLAYTLDMPQMLLLIGIVYVIEFLSVVIEIIYFKITHGKKLFKAAPLHRHFELSGQKESKTVKIYTVAGFSGGLVSVLLIYFGNLR